MQACIRTEVLVVNDLLATEGKAIAVQVVLLPVGDTPRREVGLPDIHTRAHIYTTTQHTHTQKKHYIAQRLRRDSPSVQHRWRKTE